MVVIRVSKDLEVLEVVKMTIWYEGKKKGEKVEAEQMRLQLRKR